MTQELNKDGLEAAENAIYDYCYEAGFSASTIAIRAIQAYLNHTKARKAQRGRNI